MSLLIKFTFSSMYSYFKNYILLLHVFIRVKKSTGVMPFGVNIFYVLLLLNTLTPTTVYY